jgi:hypothetical protein
MAGWQKGELQVERTAEAQKLGLWQPHKAL